MSTIQGCVQANLTTPIFLGRQGENNATKISFDISEWRRRFGDEGEIHLYHKRPKDQFAYGVNLETSEDGNSVIWTVSAIDTDAYARYGQAELQYIVDERVVKSEIYRTSVYKSIGDFVEQYPGIIESDASAPKFAMLVTYVGKLPTIGEENRLYMVPSTYFRYHENNKYDEYIWIEFEQRYEQIGNVDVQTDYDVFMAKMNRVMYNSTHSITYGRFLIPETIKITYIKCLDESYWGHEILLTYISAHTASEPSNNENETTSEPAVDFSEVAYRVAVNENGWLELNNSGVPTTLDEINLTLIFAEGVGSTREEQELAHNPIPLRLDYANKDWIDTIEIERQAYSEFLLLAGIEKTFILTDPKPEHGWDWDELYERRHSDDTHIYDLIGADENGFYYHRIYFENGVIPQGKDVYKAVYTRS